MGSEGFTDGGIYGPSRGVATRVGKGGRGGRAQSRAGPTYGTRGDGYIAGGT